MSANSEDRILLLKKWQRRLGLTAGAELEIEFPVTAERSNGCFSP